MTVLCCCAVACYVVCKRCQKTSRVATDAELWAEDDGSVPESSTARGAPARRTAMPKCKEGGRKTTTRKKGFARVSSSEISEL